MTFTIKAKQIFAYLALGLFALFVGQCIFWSVQPTDVLEVKRFKVTPTQADHIVTLEIDYCKKLEIEGTLVRKLVSKRSEILLPTITERQPKACTQIKSPSLLPPHAAPDTYVIKYIVTYKINPLKTVTEEVESEPFTIVTASGQGPQGVQGMQGIQGVQGKTGTPGQ